MSPARQIGSYGGPSTEHFHGNPGSFEEGTYSFCGIAVISRQLHPFAVDADAAHADTLISSCPEDQRAVPSRRQGLSELNGRQRGCRDRKRSAESSHHDIAVSHFEPHPVEAVRDQQTKDKRNDHQTERSSGCSNEDEANDERPADRDDGPAKPNRTESEHVGL